MNTPLPNVDLPLLMTPRQFAEHAGMRLEWLHLLWAQGLGPRGAPGEDDTYTSHATMLNAGCGRRRKESRGGTRPRTPQGKSPAPSRRGSGLNCRSLDSVERRKCVCLRNIVHHQPDNTRRVSTMNTKTTKTTKTLQDKKKKTKRVR
jgi:hypothetical protein